MAGMTKYARSKQAARIAAARDRLNSGKYLSEILKLLQNEWPSDRIQECKAKLDGWFRLLNKVLPDVKYNELVIEHSTDPEELKDELREYLRNPAVAQYLAAALSDSETEGSTIN
jgi:hypothetical protein